MKFDSLRATAEPVALDHHLLLALIAARAAATPTARVQARLGGSEADAPVAAFAPFIAWGAGKDAGNPDPSATRQPPLSDGADRPIERPARRAGQRERP